MSEKPDFWLDELISKRSNREMMALGKIYQYGGIDGGHHKQWLIDQVVRELTGEYYKQWVKNYEMGEDGPQTYEWDQGIAP